MEQVSLLGESGLLLPFALVYAVVLHRCQSPDMASRWLRAVFLCALFIATAKVATHAANQLQATSQIANISGHTALAGTGFLCWALTTSGSVWRFVALVVALIILAAVGVSRMVLGAHDLTEVVMGAVVALVVTAMFARRLQAPRREGRLWWWVAGIVVLGRAAMFALQVTPENVTQLMGSTVAAVVGNLI